MHFYVFSLITCTSMLLLPVSIEGLGKESPVVTKEIQQIYQEALIERQNGRLENAKELLQKVVQLTPKNQQKTFFFFDTLVMLAVIDFQQEDYEKLSQRCDYITSLSPPNEIAFQIGILKSKTFLKQNDSEQAYAQLLKLESQTPLEKWDENARAFYVGIEQSLNQKNENALRQAQRLSDAGLFEESLPLYEEVLGNIEKHQYPTLNKSPYKSRIINKIYFRVAKSYCETDNFEKGAYYLSLIHEDDSHIQPEKLLLLTKIYNGERKHTQALATAEQYLKTGSQDDLQEIYWEMGYSYFFLNDFNQATIFLNKVTEKDADPQLYYLSSLYLGRVYLHDKKYNEVKGVAQHLLDIIPEQNSLRYEVDYLMGEVCFEQGQLEDAIMHYQKALPKRNQSLALWGKQTLKNLAYCYLTQAQNSYIGQEQVSLFESAEKYTKELIALENNETNTLLLAEIYLEKYKILQDPQTRSHLVSLLDQEHEIETVDGHLKKLFIQAEIAESFQEKINLYNQATISDFSQGTLYGQAWFLKGLCEYHQAMHLIEIQENVGALWDTSIKSFLRSIRLLEKQDAQKAGLGMFYAALSYSHLGTRESLSTSLNLIERLTTTHKQIFEKLPNQGEILYTKGWVAFQIYQLDNKEEFLTIAKSSIENLLDRSPHDSFYDDSLNLLGTIEFRMGHYEQAETLFVRLAQEVPESPYAAQAWFWASESADWQHKPIETVRFYRMQVFEKYPQAACAPDAYFHFYSFAQYSNGDPYALDHLKKLPEKYPDSHVSILAHYLLGMNMKKKEKGVCSIEKLEGSVHEFDQASLCFDHLYETHKIPQDQIDYYLTVMLRAKLEKSLNEFELADLTNGIKKQLCIESSLETLLSLTQNFSNKESPFFERLHESDPFLQIFEEAQFSLGQVYVKSKQESLAEEIFTQIAKTSPQDNFKSSYYQARSWFELGKIAAHKQDIVVALNAFKKAEQYSQGKIFSVEQKLELWIEQSSCYRALSDLDNSMLMLSKVINEDAASPLRVQAMFLRAEIYELQGRKELAIKQLEAITKQQGEWALKAKERLENNFGFN